MRSVRDAMRSAVDCRLIQKVMRFLGGATKDRMTNSCYLLETVQMTTPVNAAAEPLSPNMRVVLGGFDAADAELLRESLSEIGCVTRVVTIAKDILACAGQWKPAMLLLNPLIAHGFEVCRCLKNDPEQSGILVLMVAELQDVSDIERAVEAGTDDFISKPVDKAELLKRVSNMLRLSQIMKERDDTR